jgi:hypothetical protein
MMKDRWKLFSMVQSKMSLCQLWSMINHQLLMKINRYSQIKATSFNQPEYLSIDNEIMEVIEGEEPDIRTKSVALYYSMRP